MSFRRRRKCSAVLLTAVCVMSLLAGCASEGGKGRPEDVALIDPVSVEESYETVLRRNLYDYKVYDGIVCPYTEELELNRDIYIAEYDMLPGEWVNKGQTILVADTEELDQQIEDILEKMAEDEEIYQEDMKGYREELGKLQVEEKGWGDAVDAWQNWLKEKDEKGSSTSPEPQPSLDTCERNYRNALIGRQKMEAQITQREELYQLDLEHQNLLLERLRARRAESNLQAEMPGYLSNVVITGRGAYVSEGTPMAAVADPERKLLKTEFINNQDVSAAERIFAVFDGKHYDVEFEPMDAAEYKRLSEQNGKVYSTFYLPEELKDIELGAYAAVVVIRKSRQDVLTVSKKVVSTGEDESYVYVLRDGERTYAPVKTGMEDGVYVEILSGLEEGDRVLSEEAQPGEGTVQKLAVGSISHQVTKSASFTYFNQDDIVNPVKHGTVYVEECAAEIFQQVKKGDVLVKLRVEPDGNELLRLEKSLLREQERLADLKKQDEEQNARTIKSREKTIAELEKQIAEVKADYALTEIKAPYDGIIIDMNWDLWNNSLKEGDLIPAGYRFFRMSPMDSNYLTVEDGDGLLSFGNQAVVEYTGQEGGKQTVQGQVVSLNLRSVSSDMLMWDTATMMRPASGENVADALIRIPSEAVEDFVAGYLNNGGWWNSGGFQVTVTTRKMDNVVLIPKRAVVNYGGSTYARLKQEDGTVMYQGFVAGGSDNENYWVAEGLTEGMEVCIE